MTDLFLALFAQLTIALRRNPHIRTRLAIAMPILGLILVTPGILGLMVGGEFSQLNTIADKLLTPLGVIAFAIFFIVLVSYTQFQFYSASKGTDAELEALRSERAELRARLDAERSEKAQSPADVLDTIRLSLNQLTEYYTINKGQAKSSFRASMGAMVVGLLTILAGIWIFYSNPGGDVKIAIISGVAGILAEFIAGAYFYLYNRSLTQLNYFYDKLTSVQDTMLAIKLCETLPEPNSTATKERLIEVLMKPGRNAPPASVGSKSTAVSKEASRTLDQSEQDGGETRRSDA